MKRIVSVAMVVCCAVCCFAAAVPVTANLNLTTAVDGSIDAKIMNGTNVPTVSEFDATSGDYVSVSEKVFDKDTPVADFVYAYKTNEVAVPTVTFNADSLKSDDSTYVLKYTIAPDAAASVPVTADSTTVPLLSAADDPDPTSGLRVIGKTFRVSIDPVDLAKAAAGNYSADITITVSGS